tara:strand:- start:106 stop:816 length:711 start_codon:yes stop_codon:yes gene_type:complete
MTDLLEIYKKSFDKKGDTGIIGPPTPGSYLGSNPGPMPPKPSPIKKEYLEIRENQPLDGTSIDGGSTNDPASGFIQIYNGENPYYTDNEGIVRATDGESPLTNTLKVTALDVENPEAGVEQGAGGGPNRTSAANGVKSNFLLGGDYKVLRYPTRAQFIDTNVNSEDAGTLETMTLQQYTPNRTYLEVLADPSLEIEAVIESNTEQPAKGGIPDSIDESMLPKDVKPKLNDLKNFKI